MEERDDRMRYAMFLAGLAVAGCAAEPEPQGREIYAAYCAGCHGEWAQGDGILAADLPVRPPDLTRLSAANGGVFPYSRVMAQIHGYPGRFHVMPEFGPLLQSRPVMWQDETGAMVETPQALLEVARYLASIQRN